MNFSWMGSKMGRSTEGVSSWLNSGRITFEEHTIDRKIIKEKHKECTILWIHAALEGGTAVEWMRMRVKERETTHLLPTWLFDSNSHVGNYPTKQLDTRHYPAWIKNPNIYIYSAELHLSMTWRNCHCFVELNYWKCCFACEFKLWLQENTVVSTAIRAKIVIRSCKTCV